MTQEEKELLLKDLCARLPYRVVINCTEEDDERTNFNCFLVPDVIRGIKSKTAYWIIKPYLRPMSSMTEEERKELEHLSDEYFGIALDKQIEELVSSSSKEGSRVLEYIASSVVTDWLNAHHFDFRDLIEKGLALEAPEGMYKTE